MLDKRPGMLVATSARGRRALLTNGAKERGWDEGKGDGRICIRDLSASAWDSKGYFGGTQSRTLHGHEIIFSHFDACHRTLGLCS